MGRPLSMVLGARVVDATGAGMSRRAAATRFRISAVTAVRWAQLQRDRGSIACMPQGGDMRSRTTEVHAAGIMAAYEATLDITLAELRESLARDGIGLAVATVWRFFRRRRITGSRERKDGPRRRAG